MPPARKPWPMKWIVLLILVFVVPYTYLNLHFRKPGPGYEPYRDLKERKAVLAAGYQDSEVEVLRPADPRPPPVSTSVTSAAGGLPADLRSRLPAAPHLAETIAAVAAPGTAVAASAYRIQFNCRQRDGGEQLMGARLYLKGGDILLVPEFEHLADGLIARARDTPIILTVPAGTIPAGKYRVTLVGADESKSWSLQVN